MDNSTPDFQSLAARVERLERQYHWLKSEVVTEKLVVVDSDGNAVATLGAVGAETGLTFHDTRGNVRAFIKVSTEGPSLRLVAPQSNAALELTVGERGPRISLTDTEGRQRLSLDIVHNDFFPSGSPALTLREPNGTAIVTATAVEDRPSVCLFESE